jgi:hypothetical protein
MFQVGILSGVTLEKAPALNEKGTLEIYAKQGGEVSAIDAFNSTSDSSSVSGQTNTFMEFNPFTVNRFGNDLSSDDIQKEVKAFKDKLTHIVLFYKTQDKTKWAITRGTGITDANVATKVKDQGVLDILYKNICEDFIKNMADVDLTKPFHLKTVRQSEKKHYAKLPDSRFGYDGQNAFIQDATLNCTLKYSQYELGFRKGEKTGVDLSSPAPYAADSVLSADEAADQANEVNGVFGA